MNRNELTCSNLHYANAKVFELCGYPKPMQKIEKKFSIYNKKRKIGKRNLVRKNANKYAHSTD